MRIQIKIPDALRDAGAPTFEEFARNREKWLRIESLLFDKVDEGGHTLRHLMKTMTFEIFGHKCKNLEEVQKIANSEGYQIDHLDAKPNFIPEPGGSGSAPKGVMHVVFEPKLIYLRE